ncbi:MAG: 50S ribosomal protein L7/L12 [Nitrospinota bacterium]|nr:50S ribosomal protein L7/L12 [Nitrospinota bacterium]
MSGAVKIAKKDVVSFIESMSVIELSEFVKELEEKFGVSAAPVAMAGVAAVVSGEAVSDEPSTVSVILAAAGDKKIQVIKVIREITALGLKEAKDLVDGAPKPVKEGIEKAEAEAIKAKLVEVGATIEIK